MILFFDDEMMFTGPYVRALERAGYAVKILNNVRDVLGFFRDALGQIELVVMDIMAPVYEPIPEELTDYDLQGGLRTGEALLHAMNSSDAGQRVPKIILTNIPDDDLREAHDGKGGVRGLYHKKDVLPSELVRIVRQTIGEPGQ